MANSNDPMAGEQAAPEKAAEQQAAADWPRPGEEGFVHPDGTAQAARQLEENRRAAADRAAAGSTVHGAPSLGADLGVAGGVAEKRAEAYSGPSASDARKAHAEWVDEKRDEVAEEAAGEPAAESRPAAKPASKTADKPS
jgi:hypothetical protein